VRRNPTFSGDVNGDGMKDYEIFPKSGGRTSEVVHVHRLPDSEM